MGSRRRLTAALRWVAAVVFTLRGVSPGGDRPVRAGCGCGVAAVFTSPGASPGCDPVTGRGVSGGWSVCRKGVHHGGRAEDQGGPRVRRETGRRSGWKSLTMKGRANHIGPESCVAGREVTDEAATGAPVGQVLSRESSLVRDADAVCGAEGSIPTEFAKTLKWRGIFCLARRECDWLSVGDSSRPGRRPADRRGSQHMRLSLPRCWAMPTG